MSSKVYREQEAAKKYGRITGMYLFLLLMVAGLSLVSNNLWGGKPEKIDLPPTMVLKGEMTMREVASSNNLPKEVVQKAFSLDSGTARETKLADLGLTPAQAEARLREKYAIYKEHGSKNWKKIFSKFILWFSFLPLAFYLIRRKKMTASVRRGMLASAVLIFGVGLGADPSPMGTVKDAVALFGSTGAIFRPRMIALTVFLLTVILANKFICSWGCQLGVLQDLIHRMNRGKNDRRKTFPQWRPPFWISNTVRLATFGGLAVGAFMWAVDIIEPIDPFRIFKPAHLGIAGGVTAFLVLTASLFIYRPWCHFFCPFGLVGWLGEKVSLFKVKVDYENCPKCDACEKACPSTAMGAILRRDRIIPDCFSCAACVDVCPTGAISFGVGPRERPSQEWIKMPKGGNQTLNERESVAA